MKQHGRVAWGEDCLREAGVCQPSTLCQDKLCQVEKPEQLHCRAMSIFRTLKECIYDLRMQRRWHVRRQVERQRSQHYLMPSVPRASTGKTIWGTIQDR